MVVGKAVITLYIPGASSLKDKRRVLQSLLSRTRNHFNAAVAEVGEQELWQRSRVAVAVIGGDTHHAASQLQSILNFMEKDFNVEMIGVDTEIL